MGTVIHNICLCLIQTVFYAQHCKKTNQSIRFCHISNSLAPGKFWWNFRYVIFKQILLIDGWGIFCEIALICMSLGFTDDKSTLAQVMAWCRQATSHYLNQCWPRSKPPYGITRPQWVLQKMQKMSKPHHKALNSVHIHWQGSALWHILWSPPHRILVITPNSGYIPHDCGPVMSIAQTASLWAFGIHDWWSYWLAGLSTVTYPLIYATPVTGGRLGVHKTDRSDPHLVHQKSKINSMFISIILWYLSPYVTTKSRRTQLLLFCLAVVNGIKPILSYHILVVQVPAP